MEKFTQKNRFSKTGVQENAQAEDRHKRIRTGSREEARHNPSRTCEDIQLYETSNRYRLKKSKNHAKKKTFTYAEKHPVDVIFYLIKMVLLVVTMKANKFVFVDESGLNREYRRLYARAKRGVKVHEKTSGKREKRTNIIAGLVYDETSERHIAVQCYEHSTTAAFFEDWFEFELIPMLPENAIVILDNASFHHKDRLYGIASRYGLGLLFLPPYSPDFNPIEHSWANFKQWLRLFSWRFPIFDFALECFFNP